MNKSDNKYKWEVMPEVDILSDKWPVISITSKAWEKKQGEGLFWNKIDLKT